MDFLSVCMTEMFVQKMSLLQVSRGRYVLNTVSKFDLFSYAAWDPLKIICMAGIISPMSDFTLLNICNLCNSRHMLPVSWQIMCNC